MFVFAFVVVLVVVVVVHRPNDHFFWGVIFGAKVKTRSGIAGPGGMLNFLCIVSGTNSPIHK